MKYMGSKASVSKELIPIIIKDRKENQFYVEPFVGGANMIDKVDGNRLGSDFNKYLISLLKELQNGWIPTYIEKDKYNDIRANKDNYEDYIVGWAGICCSYCGKWFSGFAGETKTRNGVRNYQTEALFNVLKQLPKLTDVEFVYSDYLDLVIPNNSIIYLDPPYKGVTKYPPDFNHDVFWEYARIISNEGHSVYISEYEAPEDFECIWQRKYQSSLSSNGEVGGSKISVEKLFKLKQ